MAKGYISINRSIEDNWLWKEKPFSKGQAWIDLILLANHADVKKPYGDSITIFQKGSVYRPISSLAERWGWDRKKVKRFLDVLQSDQMVTVDSTRGGTTITLINYGKYQGQGSTNGTTYGTTDGTTHGTQTIITNNYQTLPKARKRAERVKQDEIWEGFKAEMMRRGEWQ